MAKFDYRTLTPAEQAAARAELAEMLAALRRKADIQEFLLDVLTPSEAAMLIRRIRIAKMLLRGDTYVEIRRELNVGFTTITAVDTWLSRKFASYRQLITPLLRKEDRKGKRSLPWEEGPFKALRRRYPLHFLFLSVLLDDMEWSNPRSKE
jgi:uncharacterized protein YerC